MARLARAVPFAVCPESDAPLLPGEDPRHIQGGDVEHWIEVYQELVAGINDVLGLMRSRATPRADSTAALEQYLERLDARLAYWISQRK